MDYAAGFALGRRNFVFGWFFNRSCKNTHGRQQGSDHTIKPAFKYYFLFCKDTGKRWKQCQRNTIWCKTDACENPFPYVQRKCVGWQYEGNISSAHVQWYMDGKTCKKKSTRQNMLQIACYNGKLNLLFRNIGLYCGLRNPNFKQTKKHRTVCKLLFKICLCVLLLGCC